MFYTVAKICVLIQIVLSCVFAFYDIATATHFIALAVLFQLFAMEEKL